MTGVVESHAGGEEIRVSYAFGGAGTELDRTLPLADGEEVVVHGVMRLRSEGLLPRPALIRLTHPRLVVLAHYAFRSDRAWNLPRTAVRTVDLAGTEVRIAWATTDGASKLLRLTPWTGRAALDRPLRDGGAVFEALRRWL